MCKGDGNKILSNVELILPWNVVEACYNLEPADSTCFFATNKEEETQSQISLFKQEDHSVKIQVTVMALSSDDADAEMTEEVEAGTSKDDEPERMDEGPQTREKSGSTKKYSLRRSGPPEKDIPETPKRGTPKKNQPPPPTEEAEEKPQEEHGEDEAGGSTKSKKFRPKPRHISTVKPMQMNKRLTAIWGARKRKHKHQQLLAAAKQKQQNLASKGITTRSGKRASVENPESEPKPKQKDTETPKSKKKELKEPEGMPTEEQVEEEEIREQSLAPAEEGDAPKAKSTAKSPKRGYQFNEAEWSGEPIPVEEVDEPHMPVLEAVDHEDDYFPPPPPASQEEEVEIKYWEEVKRQYQKQVQLQMEELEGKRRQEEADWDKLASAVSETQKARSMVIVIKPNDDEEQSGNPRPVTPKGKKSRKRKTEDDDVIITKAPRSGKKGKGGHSPRRRLTEGGTRVIYIHTPGSLKGEPEDDDDEDRPKKKFFKAKREASRIKNPIAEFTSKSEPHWKMGTYTGLKKLKPPKVYDDGTDANIPCKLCTSRFKNYGYLFRHVRLFHKEHPKATDYMEEIRPLMKIPCPICGKVISSIGNISAHIKQCHPDGDISVTCDLCGNIYKTPASLKQHIRQRHGDNRRKHVCVICGADFTERRSLNDHINCLHETTQVFTCTKCWKVFLTKSRLRRHMYIHGEIRHTCLICGKGFHIKDNMNKHIRIVHEKNDGDKHECEHCGKKFLVKGNLTQHIRGVHLKQFPFKCGNCQTGFRRMKDMMLHMEKCVGEDGQPAEAMEGGSVIVTPKRKRGNRRSSTKISPVIPVEDADEFHDPRYDAQGEEYIARYEDEEDEDEDGEAPIQETLIEIVPSEEYDGQGTPLDTNTIEIQIQNDPSQAIEGEVQDVIEAEAVVNGEPQTWEEAPQEQEPADNKSEVKNIQPGGMLEVIDASEEIVG